MTEFINKDISVVHKSIIISECKVSIILVEIEIKHVGDVQLNVREQLIKIKRE